MAKQKALFLPTGYNAASVQLIAGGGTTPLTTLYTAGVNDTNLKMMIATSTDTVARNLQIFVARTGGGTDFLLGTILVPANAGNTGAIASVDLLDPNLIPGLLIDNTGKFMLPLKALDVVKVQLLVALTTAKFLNVLAVGDDL